MTRQLASIAVMITIASSIAHGQHAAHAGARAIPLDVLQRPVSLRTGIGLAREALTTTSSEARAFYEQGLAQLHSFSWIDAARSFHTALRHDPKLAMAHLGLSFAFGGLAAAQGASEALERARALASGASVRERLRITLRGQQLQAFAKSDDAALATGYRAALDKALTAFPDDVELLLLRAQAEDESGTAQPGALGGVPFYQRAMRAAPHQFAARHYLVHAFENAGRIDLALTEAEAYVKMAPAVPHAHHMYAHGLRRAGRTSEAIAAFRKADELERAHLQAESIALEYEWHHHHNQTLMAAAYQYVGQLQTAREQLKSIFELTAPLLTEELAKRDWPALLLASGAFDEALKASQRLTTHPLPLLRAAGHLAAARIHMTRGQLKAAGLAADAALVELRTARPEAGALAPALRLVQGEFFLRSGDREKGLAMIRQGVGELRADLGPDAWSQTLFEIEALCRAARDIGDWALAAELTEVMRQHDPVYGGTSYAAGRVAEQRGDKAAAVKSYQETVQRWKNADKDLRDLLDARQRLAALTAASR
jgi:tetratricopeptide (TPR) repeat protein